MAIKITLHGTQSGSCSLSGKECDEGFLVEFHDEGEGQVFLSQKSFIALAKMKMAKGKKDQNGKPPGVIAIDPRPDVQSGVTKGLTNGAAVSDGKGTTEAQMKTVTNTVAK